MYIVIQPNMPPKAIVEVWISTEKVFKKHSVPISDKALESLLGSDDLSVPLNELNDLVGSSAATCIEGG